MSNEEEGRYYTVQIPGQSALPRRCTKSVFQFHHNAISHNKITLINYFNVN